MFLPAFCVSIPGDILLLTRLLGVAAHDLDLIRCDIILIVQLEVDILDEERPDFVAEAVGIEMALQACNVSHSPRPETPRHLYLEVHASLDFVRQHLGDGFIEGSHDFHGGLGLDAAGMNHLVEGVNKGHTDAAKEILLVLRAASRK